MAVSIGHGMFYGLLELALALALLVVGIFLLNTTRLSEDTGMFWGIFCLVYVPFLALGAYLSISERLNERRKEARVRAWREATRAAREEAGDLATDAGSSGHDSGGGCGSGGGGGCGGGGGGN